MRWKIGDREDDVMKRGIGVTILCRCRSERREDESTFDMPNDGQNNHWSQRDVCIGQRKEETRSERVPFLILP
jgi:hypothetical protein